MKEFSLGPYARDTFRTVVSESSVILAATITFFFFLAGWLLTQLHYQSHC
jgi:hypothetical protein